MRNITIKIQETNDGGYLVKVGEFLIGKQTFVAENLESLRTKTDKILLNYFGEKKEEKH